MIGRKGEKRGITLSTDAMMSVLCMTDRESVFIASTIKMMWQSIKLIPRQIINLTSHVSLNLAR
ncbi:hypothetical protein C9I90_04825 [Photobacterium aphoticum]|uniref:Uncharacterized protein n=1 Tax=Photobacterium aphoticum TaxID=754436 RepID=A0A0J1GHD4_9GAMM|nr:hypothetical protein ABT58_19165 [Photobacterium aphoticum]PSU59079.1 hypothetical protein C9I90_04825 [Photobacterium aphoticum]